MATWKDSNIVISVLNGGNDRVVANGDGAVSYLPTGTYQYIMHDGECAICFETGPIREAPCCGIRLCFSCLDSYTSGKIDEGMIDIPCPGHPCQVTMRHAIAKKFISVEKSERLDNLRAKADNKHKKHKACPSCNKILSVDAKFYQNVHGEADCTLVCSGCSTKVCYLCIKTSHVGKTCEESNASATDTKVEIWAAKKGIGGHRNAQRCPQCKIWIERTEGCYMMTCTECQTAFCFDCGARTPHTVGALCTNARLAMYGEPITAREVTAPRTRYREEAGGNLQAREFTPTKLSRIREHLRRRCRRIREIVVDGLQKLLFLVIVLIILAVVLSILWQIICVIIQPILIASGVASPWGQKSDPPGNDTAHSS